MIKVKKSFLCFAIAIMFMISCVAVALNLNISSVSAAQSGVFLLKDGHVKVEYSDSVRSSGHQENYKYTTSSLLIEGLTLDTSGTISGTPLESGEFIFVVFLTDTNGTEDEEDDTVMISYSCFLKITGDEPCAKEVCKVDYKSTPFNSSTINMSNFQKSTRTSEFDCNMQLLKETTVNETIRMPETEKKRTINTSCTTYYYNEAGQIVSIISTNYENYIIKERGVRKNEYNADGKVVKFTETHTTASSYSSSESEVVYSNSIRTINTTSFSSEAGSEERSYEYSTDIIDEAINKTTSFEYADEGRTIVTRKNIHAQISEQQSIRETWIKLNENVRYTKTINTIEKSENCEKSTAIDSTYTGTSIEDFDWATADETDKNKAITEIKELPDGTRSYENTYFDKDDVLASHSRSERKTETVNDVTTTTTKFYNYDGDNEKLYSVSQESKLENKLYVFSSETLNAALLKISEDSYYYSSNITLEGDDFVITKDLTIPENINLTLNNIIIEKDVKLSIPESSNVVMLGKAICDGAIVAENSTLSGGATLEGLKTQKTPIVLIVLLSVFGAILISYFVGFIIAKKKKTKFLKRLYPFYKENSKEENTNK